jgi:hypothetical protein
MDDFTGGLRKIEIEDSDPRLSCERHPSARDGSGIDFQVRVEYGRHRKFRFGPSQQASEKSNRVFNEVIAVNRGSPSRPDYS